MEKKFERNLYIKDAHLYDLDNRYLLKADIPFYIDFAAKNKGPILELASGTGRVTIPLAEAGNEMWGIELSETMIEQFKSKLKKLPRETVNRVHLIKGDMSNFKLEQKFPLVIIPYRSFQVLQDENLENACLQGIYNHMTDDGYFIITLGNFAKVADREWEKDDEVFDWENIDPQTGYNVRRTHRKKGIDKTNQVVHIQKTYYITKGNELIDKISKEISAKYFFENQIKERLSYKGFKIIDEMGSYDGKPITEGTEFIFMCQKK
ncbi:MAG: class I SAM-dependent methyltransferase [Candidatus Aminicenantes bacterium]|nr:class I SAM-dependent methyltransferase [Candidatus Aminicenantes bacterium]